VTSNDDSPDAPPDRADRADRADRDAPQAEHAEHDEGADDAGAGEAGAGQPGTGEAAGEPRRRRRRRRHRSDATTADGPPGAPAGEPGAEASPIAPGGRTPSPRRGSEPRRDDRNGRDDRSRGNADRGRGNVDRSRGDADRSQSGTARSSGEAAPPSGEPERRHEPGAGGDPHARGRDERGPGRGRGDQRGGDQRGGDQRGGRPPRGDQRGGDQRGGDQRGERTARGERTGEQRGGRGGEGRPRGGEAPQAGREAEQDAQQERYALLTSTLEGPTIRLDPRRPVAPTDDLDLDGSTTPSIPWGKDDDGPPADVVLAPDLPADAPPDDPDPLTYPLLELPSAPLGDDVASITGIRFVPGGRVQWCDAGDADYAQGERVMVDSERGARLAWIAVPPERHPIRERGMRRVIRRASEQDLRGEREGDADRAQALRVAKDKAAALRLPLKVFRVEVLTSSGQLGRGARLNIYYTTDERLDLRDFIHDVSAALGGPRVELRQLGVRDEAKAVGGIGSCGLTLCCTTWLPDFVPVSIKMAKDQGLVLSPTKVSGQCGRLKCCLVYEQAAYAELRKGLPKLGKRVIAARGEGRVVEVDVLRQRIRVSYGPGDTEVVPATDVKPLFPSGNQPAARGPGTIGATYHDDADDMGGSSGAIELPTSLATMADALDDAALDPTASDPEIHPPPDDDPS
jgi:cell fate regulator YaaT (PSP1 superfamily)